jgi:branched-chain amino acid transport system substrate-binding protein
MSLKRFSYILLVVLVVGATAFAVAACGDTAGSGTDTTAAPVTTQAPATTEGPATTAAPSTDTTAAAEAPVAVKEWVIPQISVTSGPVAFAGEPAAWGAQKAVDEINAAGGIRGVPVKLELSDTGFDTAKAVSAATAAVADALVVLGPMDAPGGEAAAPIYFENKVPAICAVSNVAIRESTAPYTCFYMADNADDKAVLAWIKQNPDIKSVVAFGDPSDPGAYDGYKLAKAALEGAGVTYAKEIEVKSGQLDLATPAVQALDAKADGYVCILRQEEMAKLGLELKKRGMTEPRRIYMTFAALGSGLLDLAQGSLEGAYGYNNFDPNATNDKYVAFAQAFSAAHDGQPLVINTPVTHYNAVYAIAGVIEDLKITGDPAKLAEERQKIAEALSNSRQFEGLQGPFSWIKGQLQTSVYLMQIKDNKIVTVGPID